MPPGRALAGGKNPVLAETIVRDHDHLRGRDRVQTSSLGVLSRFHPVSSADSLVPSVGSIGAEYYPLIFRMRAPRPSAPRTRAFAPFFRQLQWTIFGGRESPARPDAGNLLNPRVKLTLNGLSFVAKRLALLPKSKQGNGTLPREARMRMRAASRHPTATKSQMQ